MADFRQIHTSIWDDDWFCQLSSDEKVVFVWLFSNRRASVSGLYEFTEFICSRETGLSLQIVKECIKKLSDDKKIYVEGDWVWVKNLRKYNYYKNPKADKRIQTDLDKLPDNGLKKAYIDYYKPLDSPSQAPSIPLPEQEHEQEYEIKQRNKGASASNYTRIFSGVTNMVAIPGNDENVYHAIDQLGTKYKTEDELIEYLKPYFQKWIKTKSKEGRLYSKTNNAWLTTYAIAGEMPGENGNGSKARKVFT